MKGIGNPLRANFYDADPQLRKPFRNAIVYKRMKGSHNDELELTKAGFVEKKVVRRNAAVRRVHADRDVELACGIVQRKEIRIAESPVGFQPSHINAASAMFFAELQLIGHLTHVEQ